MLPVTVGLGIINFDLLINSTLGSLVSDQAPRAIDAAFRIYMLPQGMFSVALATVLFPALSRFASRKDFRNLGTTAANGMRQIFLLLVPAAAITIALATPITRLVYQRGAFDAAVDRQVSEALFWFSFSLPFAGVNLLMTRTFFSMQTPVDPDRPWPRRASLVNAAVSLLLYKPLGIAGLVIGTAVASLVMTIGQAHSCCAGRCPRSRSSRPSTPSWSWPRRRRSSAASPTVVWYLLDQPARALAAGADRLASASRITAGIGRLRLHRCSACASTRPSRSALVKSLLSADAPCARPRGP